MNPADVVCLMHRKFWFDDCCAAERSLAGSAAATDCITEHMPDGVAREVLLEGEDIARVNGYNMPTNCQVPNAVSTYPVP
ncbi:hypothetical protein CNN82_20760 [Pseudomonas frederiksbergensis]|uniref:Uncharacterized protein n=1 Tax=Pseudomonas frederiksbergensis TaxID=104087 RepID=A0AB33EEC8_9PSED|nr:hypothetical protein CNN82_20760 [Pseudomonas frederiksbergensis]